MKAILTFCIFIFLTITNGYGQTNYSWNGSMSADFADPLNWTPSGLPASTDNITLNALGIAPLLGDSVSYNNVTITGGTPDLGGYTIYVTGNLTLSGGVVSNGLLRVNALATRTAVLSAITLASNCTLNIVTGAITLNGGIYNGPVSLQQIGAIQTTGTGGAVFHNSLSLINSGTSNFRINGNVTYNGSVIIETRSTGTILPELITGSTYNGSLTCNTYGTGSIRMAYLGTNAFNGDVVVNSNSNSNIYFCEQATANATLATGRTITAGTFTSGRLCLYRFTQVGLTPQSITLTGTANIVAGPASTFNANVALVSPQLSLNNVTFNGNATIAKTGATNNVSPGGNTFNGTADISNIGTGFLLFSNTTRDIYQDDVTFTCGNTGILYVAHNDAVGTQFNGNITLNSTGTGGIRFSQGTGTSLLATGQLLSIGAGGFSAGALYIRRFTQTGSEPITLNTFSGTTALYLQTGTVFNGNVNFTAPQLFLSGATYNGTARIEKTGATNNTGSGGNTFNSTVTLINSGTGYLMTGNGSADFFSNDLVCTNTGAGIYLAYSGGTNQFNGNIEISSTGTNGIQFGQAAVASGASVLAAGRVITIGAGGFSGSGDLRLRSFTYTNPAPLVWTLGGTSRIILGPATTFAGDVNFSAPQVFLQGTTFNGVATISKSGATNNDCTGGNTFNGVTTISQNGSGYLRLANTTRDIFNQQVTFQCGGAGILNVAFNDVTGTEFNGNVIVNCTAAGGIRFGQSAGTSRLASGNTISIGTGFSAGSLYLRNFTQLGGTAQTMTNFSGTTALYLQTGNTFNGSVEFTAPLVYLNGTTFNGAADLDQTGVSATVSTGGNTFNAPSIITVTGTGYMSIANTGNDIFNHNLELNCPGGGGIRFGQTSGTVTLAASRLVTIGAPGFTSGNLMFRNFVQTGATAQSMTLTGTAALYLQTGTVFNGDLDASSPQLYLNGAAYNGVTLLQKSGATNNTSTGSNIYNAAVSIRNSGAGILTLAGTTGDDYNADAEFIQTGAGALYPAASTTSTFAGNISTIGTTTALTFALNAGGRVVINGNVPQSFNGTVSMRPIVRRLTMSTSGTLTLNVPLDINADLNLTNGVINTTATNILALTDESVTTTIGNAGSYVNGPMNYIMNLNGTAALNFPVGKGSEWRPMVFTPTHNAATAYTYSTEMFASSAEALGYTPLPVSIDRVSDIRYWQVNRTPSINANLSSASARLYYATSGNDDGVTDAANLTVVKTVGAGTVWNDVGGTASGAGDGNVVSGTFNSSGLFTFGNLLGGSNPLPVTMLTFNVIPGKEQVNVNWSTASEENNDYFTVERSADGKNFTEVIRVDGSGTTNSIHYYSSVDKDPIDGISYYRLKQTDFNGVFSYSRIVSVNFSGKNEINVYPNPAKDLVNIEFATGNFREAKAYLVNATGQTVLVIDIVSVNGVAQFKLDISNYPSGLYWLNVYSGDTVKSTRILRQ